MQFTDTLLYRFQARYPIIWLESYDDPRVYRALKEVCKADDYNLYRWNEVDGMVELGLTLDSALPVGDLRMTADQMLAEIVRRMDSYDKEIFVVEGINDLLTDSLVRMLVKKIANELPMSKRPMHLVFFSPVALIPQDLARYIDVLRFPDCEKEDYARVLQKVLLSFSLDLSGSMRERLIEAAEGLTSMEAERIYALAAAETYLEETALEVVRREKERIEEKMDLFPR